MATETRVIKNEWFVDGSVDAGRPILEGNKCKLCGKVFFPKKAICPVCIKEDTLENMPLSTRGKLYSFTVIYIGDERFSPPYSFGWVDLPERLRIYSLLTPPDPEKLKIDMDVELMVGKVKEEKGVNYISYMFKPVEGGE